MEENKMVLANDTYVVEKDDSGVKTMLSDLSNPNMNNMYISFRPEKQEDKIRLYNSINNPSKKLSDCVNIKIEMVDVIAHNITLMDEETGELINCIRTIIIDKDGNTYDAVSEGVANSLQYIFSIFGQPGDWDAPLPVQVIRKKTRNKNNMVTILQVMDK